MFTTRSFREPGKISSWRGPALCSNMENKRMCSSRVCDVPFGAGLLHPSLPWPSRLGDTEAQILLGGQGLLSSAGSLSIHFCQNCWEKRLVAQAQRDNPAPQDLAEDAPSPPAEHSFPGSSRTTLLLPHQCPGGQVSIPPPPFLGK